MPVVDDQINLLTDANQISYMESIASSGSPAKSRPALGACPVLRWYVVEAEHQKLARAVRSVIDLKFDTYQPMMSVRIRDTVNGKRSPVFTHVLRPMFFQFFFVQFDAEHDPWGSLRPDKGNGIKRLLMTPGQRPALADRGYGMRIEQLKATEEDRLRLPETGMKPLRPGTLALVRTTPRVIDGVEVYPAFGGQVIEVESCDGFTTIGWSGLFGGRTKAIMPRAELSDE